MLAIYVPCTVLFLSYACLILSYTCLVLAYARTCLMLVTCLSYTRLILILVLHMPNVCCVPAFYLPYQPYTRIILALVMPYTQLVLRLSYACAILAYTPSSLTLVLYLPCTCHTLLSYDNYRKLALHLY